MATNEMATQAPQKLTLRQQLDGDQFKMQVSTALPSHVKPERFIRVAKTAMMKNPKLAECTPETFFLSVLSVAQMGLECDGRLAHLVPFWNSKKNANDCQLIIGYQGLVALAHRSGDIEYIHAEAICEADDFEYNMGQVVKHKIDFRKDRGPAYAFYAMAQFKTGAKSFAVMSIQEIDGIKARSKSRGKGGSSPWDTDFGEMAKKTVVRRLAKMLPLSPEFRDAVDKDEEIDVTPQSTALPRPMFGGKPLDVTPEPEQAPLTEEQLNDPTPAEVVP